MATDTKSPEGEQAAKPRKPPKPRYKGEISFDTLGVETDIPKRKRSRTSADLTTYKQMLTKSVALTEAAKGKPTGVGLTVPTAAVSLVKSRLGTASAEMNLGASISVFDYGDEGADIYNLQPDYSRVVVIAKTRRVIHRKAKS